MLRMCVNSKSTPRRLYEHPQDEQERRIYFPISSPELLITVKQIIHERDPLAEDDQPGLKATGEQPVSARYVLLGVIDTGIASGESGVSGEGPALYMQPEEKRLLSFICNLRAEAEMTLLLDE